ncbi:hypothetical protein D9M70_269780 [compost metagenome]
MGEAHLLAAQLLAHQEAGDAEKAGQQPLAGEATQRPHGKGLDGAQLQAIALLHQLQLIGQAEHPVILQGELQRVPEAGTGEHRIAEDAVGGDVQPLPEHQPQGRLAALLQGHAGELVEIQEGQPAIGVTEDFRLDPGAGQQHRARNAQLLGQGQQGFGIGDGHQFGGEGQRLSHIGVLFWAMAGYDPKVGRR